MKLLKKYGLAIFWILLFLDCFLINFKSFADYRIYTKPLQLIVLAVYFYINTKRSKHTNSKTLVYSGLLFCWLGDWFLLKNDFISNYTITRFSGDIYLLIGLILLLIGFSMYTLLFKKMSDFNIKDCQEAFLSFLAMSVVTTVYYKVLKAEDLGKFKIVIIIGIIALTIMMMMAANVSHNKIRRNISMQFLIPGCITLIISMGIVIAHRFLLKDGEFLPAVIELTYGFGQMLILRGFTKYLK